jgi:hypothetical protein
VHEWELLSQDDGSFTTVSGALETPGDITLARSGLIWVKVENGKPSSSWSNADNSMSGFALYEALEWNTAHSD